MKINVVLVEPEIPQNTGNIARTCAAIGATLHLVKPLGFEISDKDLKRAGLDYWNKLDVIYYEDLEDFLNKNKNKEMFYVSTKSQKYYSEITYIQYQEIYLLFGKETKGLPEELLVNNIDRCIRIPMNENIRSLNLSNSVAVVVYEALRQHDFKDMKKTSQYFK